ncbi:MAG: GNAT family N-acetyltransferase [Gemmatimonadaceae bacterium]
MDHTPGNSPSHPLDRVIWESLATHHRSFAIGNDLARRYPPDVAPFAAMVDTSAECREALSQLITPGDHSVLFTLEDLPTIAGLEVSSIKNIDQMIGPTVIDAPANRQIEKLGASDIDEMSALVRLTKPGPFDRRAMEMGDFFGIRVDGRLAAITGERLHPTGYRELTAVCAHPDFRGRGFPRDLVLSVSRGIADRGETPFLHVLSDNLAAITLYQKLGFLRRTTLRITVLRKPV